MTNQNDTIQNFLKQEFNFISKKVLETCVENFEIYITKPSTDLIAIQWLKENPETLEKVQKFFKTLDLQERSSELACTLRDYLYDNYHDELHYFYSCLNHKAIDDNFLEIRNRDFEEWANSHKDELFKHGIGIVESTTFFKSMLFVSRAGLDFNNSHWSKLYQMKDLS